MGRGYLLIYNLAWRPSVPVAILQARAAPRRSIYDSTRTSNPDTNSISVIISERVSIPMDDASLASPLSPWKTEERDRKRGRGCSLQPQLLEIEHTVALVRESGVTRDFLVLESFLHNIVNLSFKGYPEIEFSSRGLKKKIKKYNFHLFPSQFYSFDRTKDIFPRIFLETISRYISLFFPKDIFLETVERQWGKRWNSVGGKGGRKEGRNWRADC